MNILEEGLKSKGVTKTGRQIIILQSTMIPQFKSESYFPGFISIVKQLDVQFSSLLNITLHVSDSLSVHHQEF
jgi:uncharacterized membrane protein YgcG